MTVDREAVAAIVHELEASWNAADGARFGVPFTDDADFVTIRAEHLRGREAIAKGHQGIFNSIYKGSTVSYELVNVRPIAPGVQVAHVRTELNAPSGPLAGRHNSLFTIVLVQQQNDWRIAAFHNTLVR
ncbi:MAG TPA: SgcJ/EcaC family oxidoreductase [Vicinamibacterales bacterium]|jgi:uncharacterized protein (TIGR02246 family)